MDKKTLHFIHDDELDAFLNNIGLAQQINEGKIRCKFCKEAIELEYIHSIFPEAGNIKVSCNSIECIKSLTDFLNTHKMKD